MRATLALTALLLTPILFPVSDAAGASPVSVAGPDADGSYLLSYDVERAADGPAALALDVVRDDLGDVATGRRDLGTRALVAGANRVEASFLPAEGAGAYRVRLVVDGQASAPLAFDVGDGGATASVAFTVPDEPTFLNLTNESVNGDGKLKSPGEELITRATLVDGNGVSDVRLEYRVERAGILVDAGPVALAAPANATGASVELRYARSPLAVGAYRLTLAAVKDAAAVASASRTFAIREVPATLENATLAPVVPDEWSNATHALVLADRNGHDPTHPVEARVYKGTTRVESQGFAITLGAPSPLPDLNGAGRVSFPVRLTVPARAAPGAYRVSVYENGTLAGSAPFDVAALPVLLNVTATPVEGALRLDVSASGDGHVRAALDDGSATAAAALVGGHASLELPASGEGALRWTLTLHARADGPAIDARNGTWARGSDGPLLVLTPVRAPPRFPAAWTASAEGYDLSGAVGSVTVVRWDGAVEPRIQATVDGDRVRLDAPADLEAGRYIARLALQLPNGTTANASWSFEAGPWMRLSLGAPAVAGREARIVVTNAGGLAVDRLVVETEGAALVGLDVGSGPVAPSASGARSAFRGVDLAPGEAATLVVRLPDGPLKSGEHTARVRVLALAG